MKYLCLVYLEDALTETMSGPDYDAVTAELLDYRESLRAGGHDIASSSLQPGHTATTIRVRNGRILMEDGPFTDANEHLDGFYLIEAGDLNDAIRIAARLPSARIGSIEIRPVREPEPARPRQEQTANLSRY